MARCIALSILSLISIACGHADGLRAEWNEPPTNSVATVSTEAEELTEEVDPEHDYFIADDDIYTLVLDVRTDRLLDITFYDPTDGRFELSAFHCSWQGNRCIGFLPYGARRSHFFTVEMARDFCPTLRLYRNGLEIDLERMILRACAFAMEADPD